MKKHFIKTLIFLTISSLAFSQELKTIEAFTAGMEKKRRLLDFLLERKENKIWLEIDKFDTELLYYPSLAQGVGSNDIGLDRGRLGQEHVVKFQRTGNKVLMVEPNIPIVPFQTTHSNAVPLKNLLPNRFILVLM